jgi:hypothetical protein
MSIVSFALLLLANFVPQEQTYEQRLVQAAKQQRAEDLANLPELKRIGDEQRRRAAAESAENLAREQEAWRYGQAGKRTTYDNDSSYSTYVSNSYVAPTAVVVPVRVPNLILPNANVPVFSSPVVFPSRPTFVTRPFFMRR